MSKRLFLRNFITALGFLLLFTVVGCGSKETYEDGLLSENMAEDAENEEILAALDAEENEEVAESEEDKELFAEGEAEVQEEVASADEVIEEGDAAIALNEEAAPAAEENFVEGEFYEEPSTLEDTVAFNQEGSAASAAPYRKSVAPSIEANAIEQGDQLLNRYYFVRANDTAESVSKLIYGSPILADDLVKWNGGDWKPGMLVYYASPKNAKDTQMVSFYEDSGQEQELYTVQGGDWLSKIAQERYGSIWSWKEIAAVNRIDTPDLILPGQQIALYPNLANGYSAKSEDTLETVASQSNPLVPEAPAPSEVAPKVASAVGSANVAVPSPTDKLLSTPLEGGEPMVSSPTTADATPVIERELSKAEPEVAPKPQEAGGGVVGFFQRHIFTLIVGLGIGFLGLFIFLFRGRDEEEPRF